MNLAIHHLQTITPTDTEHATFVDAVAPLLAEARDRDGAEMLKLVGRG